MMNTLIINTANEELFIALKLKGKIFSKSITSSLKHNEVMLTKIDELLKESKITLNQVDNFGVVIGPGSFTGVRVGIATVKAFRDALNKEAKGINNINLLYNLAKKQNPSCEVVAIAGSKDSYFVGRVLFGKLYIYERNLSLDELKEIAKESQVGMYKIDENLNSFKVEMDPNVLFDCFDESEDEKLVPVYYQLSQAENEKIKRAEIQIEETNIADVEKIAEIESDSIKINTINKAGFERMIKDENYKIFSIKLEGEIVGFIALEFTDEVNIYTLAIKKEYRNMGFATKLLNYVMKLAKDDNLSAISLEVSVNNPTAYLLYEKNGFQLRRVRKNYYADGADCLEMVRDIN